MTTTAIQFLNEIADVIRAKGRAVEITETEESFGTFVWMYVPATHWYDRAMTFSAVKSNRTGKWSMGVLVVTNTDGKAIKADTRNSIRRVASVYA